MIVCDQVEFHTIQIVMEMLDSPPNGKTFEFGCSILNFVLVECSTGVFDSAYFVVIVLLT